MSFDKSLKQFDVDGRMQLIDRQFYLIKLPDS